MLLVFRVVGDPSRFPPTLAARKPAQAFAKLESQDCGKPIKESEEDMDLAVEAFRYSTGRHRAVHFQREATSCCCRCLLLVFVGARLLPPHQFSFLLNRKHGG